jgi:hypothetical protein
VEYTAGGDDLEIWAATTTPFTRDGKLDPAVVREQARHLVATGVDGAFVGGSTGEFPPLTTVERLELSAASTTSSPRSPVPPWPTCAPVSWRRRWPPTDRSGRSPGWPGRTARSRS